MTTKETAKALGVNERTIQRRAKELGLTENGKKSVLDEKAVTLIKTQIERSGRSDLDNVVELPKITTDLEMMILDQKVMSWKTRRIEELQEKLNEAQPKIEFFDSVTNSKDTIEMKDAAKVLNIGMGRTGLFRLLRDKKIIMGNNTPYQEYVDRGYFKVIESEWVNPNGETKINLKTVVYQKGLDYIRKVAK